MNKLAGRVALKFAAMFNIGDIILFGKYKNKKGRILSFGKNDKGQPTITVEPIPKGRKQNKVMGLYKIWTLPKEEQAKAKADAKAEKAEKEKTAALDLDPQLKQFADLLAAGLSDRKILQTMRIDYNEAHAMAHKLREALGITSMDNLRKTLKMRHSTEDTELSVYRRFYAQQQVKDSSIDLHESFPVEALKIRSRLSERVASRYVKAFGIPMGKTVDLDSVRIHRFVDHFKCWDLTNAGKRGKKVETLAISVSYAYKGDRDAWMESMSKALAECDTIADVKRRVKDILADYPGEINMESGSERGVDVNPGGTTKLQLTTNTGIRITADPLDFLLVSSVPLVDREGKPTGYKQDTLYSTSNRPGAKVFYNWLAANLAQANKMTILEFRDLWDELKIPYDYH